jgi:hypothetical protein
MPLGQRQIAADNLGTHPPALLQVADDHCSAHQRVRVRKSCELTASPRVSASAAVVTSGSGTGPGRAVKESTGAVVQAIRSARCTTILSWYLPHTYYSCLRVRACVSGTWGCAYMRARVPLCETVCLCACVCATVRDCVSVCVRACVRARVREPVFGVCVCAWLTCSLRSFPAECGPKCDNRPAAERATVGLTDLLRRSAPYQLETLARVSRLYAATRHCGTRSAASPGADVDASPGADVEPSPGADVEPSPSADVRPVPAQTCGQPLAQMWPCILTSCRFAQTSTPHGSPLVAISAALAGALADCRAARSDHLAGQVQRTDVDVRDATISSQGK